MLSKCANPSCSTRLIYLREGKLFAVQPTGRPKLSHPKLTPQGPILAKPSNSVEHFWLCGPCSERLTLVYDVEIGVRVTAKETGHPRAVAS
jgi:hypothetical protein